MKKPLQKSCCCLFIACLTTALIGCKSSHAEGPANSVPSAKVEAPSGTAVPIDRQAFTVVATTNQLDPLWLKTPTNFFRLGPGDAIEIETLGDPSSRGEAIVGPDGKIYYGLLPGTFVWGLSLSETKALIDQELQRFFREQPQVTITLRGVSSQRIWILGSVQAPGVYTLATPATVLEAISLAGGTGAGAGAGAVSETDLRNSFVMRGGRPLGVDFYQLLRKGDLTQNIYLQPDDFLYLRPGGGQYVYVLGAVGRAGVVSFTDQVSVLSAIASAGGTVPYAQASEVAVLRGSLTNPRIATVNYRGITKGAAPDILLEAGDVVYVPFSPWRKIGELADMLLKQFVSTIALNEGVHAVDSSAPPVGISVGTTGAAP